MMIKELTVKGRDDVRYIITKSTPCGNALRIDEAVAVYGSGLRLFVSAKNASDICLKTVIDTLAVLRLSGRTVHANFCVDDLFAERIRGELRSAELSDMCVVCSEEAADAARKHSSFVLTVPDSDEGCFFTLTRAEGTNKGMLLISCDPAELEKALTAISGSRERNGADQ